MEKLIARLGPYFSKSSLKPIGQVFGSQLIGKALGFSISIFLVRELSKEDYAIYTVLLTIQGMLIPLSNSAIFIGFKKIGGEVWEDIVKMSRLVKTANLISPYIIVLAFLLVGGYAFYILYLQEISVGRISWFLLCLFLIVVPEVKTAFIRSALLLRKQIAIVQVSELVGHVIRCVGIISLLLFLKSSFIIGAIFLITSLSAWISYIYVKKKGEITGISESVDVDKGYQKILLKYIKINWHNSAFFAFKGQISIFLIGIFGTTSSLADIGALSRFALVFTIITALFGNIYSPAFGRCQNLRKLNKMYVVTMVSTVLLCFLVLLVVFLIPEPFLWILGENYEHLEHELFLIFLSGSVGLLLSINYAINLSKGWIKYTPMLEIPTDIAGIVLGVLLFDVTTLTGVLYLGILSAGINFLLHLFNSVAGLRAQPSTE
ncbi:hypothetical protein RM549_03525 [Salegentibacter sp. F188]|uniref:Polysaccharide biosynthesis protein n=1 Tax=Autumnicola patrickiae TaxID=3075591 RepID=A0ABU3DYP2_9FLAO|nr:hypothetical protein [Salegentibacter sp. F188]MDT0688837.1 hypothetical protein [Salegentibacter sp. F188]